MDAVTSTDVRSWSQLVFAALGYAVDTPDPLDIEVSRASAYCEFVTGLVIAEITDAGVETRMQQAIQLRTEQQVVQRTDSFVKDQNENAIDISVTGYSQKRIAADQQDPEGMINPWKELNDLLISMLTDDKLSYWEDLGKVSGLDYNRPAEVSTDTIWIDEWTPPWA